MREDTFCKRHQGCEEKRRNPQDQIPAKIMLSSISVTMFSLLEIVLETINDAVVVIDVISMIFTVDQWLALHCCWHLFATPTANENEWDKTSRSTCL